MAHTWYIWMSVNSRILCKNTKQQEMSNDTRTYEQFAAVLLLDQKMQLNQAHKLCIIRESLGIFAQNVSKSLKNQIQGRNAPIVAFRLHVNSSKCTQQCDGWWAKTKCGRATSLRGRVVLYVLNFTQH